MNKKQWLEIKASKNYPIEMLYEFFQKKNVGKDMTLEEFQNNIHIYINVKGGIETEKLEEYFDQKYTVTKLTDKYNRLIKEY